MIREEEEAVGEVLATGEAQGRRGSLSSRGTGPGSWQQHRGKTAWPEGLTLSLIVGLSVFCI